MTWCVYRDAMTTSDATCRKECPCYPSSKTKVQIANKHEVRLCKMDEKRSADNITC